MPRLTTVFTEHIPDGVHWAVGAGGTAQNCYTVIDAELSNARREGSGLGGPLLPRGRLMSLSWGISDSARTHLVGRTDRAVALIRPAEPATAGPGQGRATARQPWGPVAAGGRDRLARIAPGKPAGAASPSPGTLCVMDRDGVTVLRVREGRLVDTGSWVYVWLRRAEPQRPVLYVGGTGLPPAVRTWLHLNDPDPDVGRLAARYPDLATQPLDVLAFELPEPLPRPLVKAALIERLHRADLLSEQYIGDPPAAGTSIVDSSVTTTVERIVANLVRARPDQSR